MNTVNPLRSLMLVLLAGSVLQAQNFFPLEPGNTWFYRSATGTQTFTIEVGLNPAVHNEHVYYRLTGYTPAPIYVRVNEWGGMVHWDQDNDVERPVTLFERTHAWFDAGARECPQLGLVQPDPAVYNGPTGSYGNVLSIKYLAFYCADAGVEEEQFLSNVGMVRRVQTTIAGPVAFDLVYARVGTLTIDERDRASVGRTALRLNVRRTSPNVLTATFRLSADQPVQLNFPSSQEYDAILRDREGNVLWKWSDGKFFTLSTKRLNARELSYDIQIPLDQITLPETPGTYDVHVWLTTFTGEREFAAIARVFLD